MEKNLLLAVALSILVYIAWFGLVEKKMAPSRMPGGTKRPPILDQGQSRRAGQPAAPGEKAYLPPDVAEAGTKPEAWHAGSAGGADPGASGAAPKAGAESKFVFLELPTANLELGSLGAGVASFKFNGPLGPVEIVPQAVPGYFSTWPELNFALLDIRNGTAVFQANHPSGIRIRKEYIFDRSGMMNKLKLVLSNPGPKPLQMSSIRVNLGPGLETVESEQKQNPSVWRAVSHSPGEKKPEKLKPGTYTGPWAWIGIDNRYFLAAFSLPDDLFEKAIVSQGIHRGKKAPQLSLASREITLAPGESLPLEIDFYMGPKNYKKLISLNLELEKAVNFGFFWFLGKGAYLSIQTISGLTGNYGAAIILFTILLQIVLFPLSYKSLKSMAQMKKLQPKIQAIQKKFKDDSKRLQLETMQLYKSAGANPLGGCLPMLLQLPIFWALFTTLRNSWELHGAPFIFWIHDLSSRDPYYALPIIMGLIMFLQQRLNPAAGDPTQAKIMTWMPILFTFMFLNFPAGLVLYWLTNSILSLMQQLVLRKRLSA